MNCKLFVGNLPYSVRTEELFKMFADYGKVLDVVVMMEPGQRDRSKGFGFVSMSSTEEAERAAAEMNGKEVMGRMIVCNIAKPKATPMA